MKFAKVEGERREAAPKLPGKCPVCDSGMVAKCGERRVWHWAHHAARNCDRWWEPETEWHRAWKNEFPADWQEIVQRADNGEKHIADVKTAHGLVVEFQHSYLRPDERRAREAIYRRMVWVVDGRRLKRSWQQFARALESGIRVSAGPLTYKVWPAECALIREWVESRVPVFFDFGDANDAERSLRFGIPVLWYLLPKSTQHEAYLLPIPRANFVMALRTGERCRGIYLPVRRRPATIVMQASRPGALPAFPKRKRGAPTFVEYLARKQRARSRMRF